MFRIALPPDLELEDNEIEDGHLYDEGAVAEHADIVHLHLVSAVKERCQINDIHDNGHQECDGRDDCDRLQTHFRNVFVLALFAGENAAEDGDEKEVVSISLISDDNIPFERKIDVEGFTFN